MFLKNVPDQTWATIVVVIFWNLLDLFKRHPGSNLKIFQNRIWTSAKYLKNNYQDKNLAPFCNVVALILSWYCVECLMINKSIKGIEFDSLGPKYSAFWQLMRLLVYTMFITNDNHALFHLWWKENSVK